MEKKSNVINANANKLSDAVNETLTATAEQSFMSTVKVNGTLSKKEQLFPAGRYYRPVFPTNWKEIQAYRYILLQGGLTMNDRKQIGIGMAIGGFGGLIAGWKGINRLLRSRGFLIRSAAKMFFIPPFISFGTTIGFGVSFALHYDRLLDVCASVIKPVGPKTEYVLRKII